MDQDVNTSTGLGKLLELPREKKGYLNAPTCSSRPEQE